MEEEMRKGKIVVGNIYAKKDNKVNIENGRVSRFSAAIHKHDGNLREGNSVRALDWAKGFRVK